MSQATANRSTQIPPIVAAKLRGLRARITTWLIVDGLSRVVLCLIALIAFDFVVDKLFELDKAQRVIMMVLSGAVLFWVVYQRLIKPMSASVSDDALCLQVEQQLGSELGESLISAVQFSRDAEPERHGVSRQLVDAAINQGTRAADRVSFGSVINSPWLFANGLLLVVGLAVIGAVGVAVATTELGDVWFNRNVLFGNKQYPQDIYLDVEYAQDGVLTIPRGDTWPLVITVNENSKREVKEVEVQFRGRSSGTRREPADVLDEGERFGITLPNVVEEFSFRAISDGNYTQWYQAKLVNRPAVKDLKLVKQFPAYTKAKDETLPPGTGPFGVLTGGKLNVTGEANKPISEATLVIGQEELPMNVDGTSFSLVVGPDDLASGQYQIKLLDTETLRQPGKNKPGPLESKRPSRFSIKVRDDRAPDVVVKLNGVSTMVVPQALIPYDCILKDEFSVTDVSLQYEWRHQDNEAASDEGEIDLKEFAKGLPAASFSFSNTFDLQPLEIPTGSQLTFRFTAHDNCVPDPNTGESTIFPLRVVTEGELRADLVRREREQRRELERLLRKQDEITTECEAILADSRGEQELKLELRQSLMKMQKQEKVIGGDTANIAKRMTGILLEAKNNRLEEDESQWRENMTTRIIGPLQDIAELGLPQVTTSMDRVRHKADDPAPRNAAFEEVIANQKQVAEVMREVLRNMEKAEGYQEAVNLLYEIAKTQESVRNMTQKEREERIRQILEGKEGSADPEDDSTPETEESD